MRSARLSLALQGGDFALPASGGIAVIGSRAGDDLSALSKSQVEIVQGFRPDHDHFAAQGYSVAPIIGGPYAAAIVCLPRTRAEAQARIAAAARAVAPGGPILIDGQKTDGVDAMLRACRARVDLLLEPIAKAHGKIFAIRADAAAFADWTPGPQTTPQGFHTAPGVFSADGADPGSALLAEFLPEEMKGLVADLGAGWGYLAATALANPRIEALHLIEADHAALNCARGNIADPRAQFHWADASVFAAALPTDQRFDWVISNPPFHTERAADPQIGIAFIRAAAHMLKGSGVLLMVANRHLPYERAMHEHFATVATVADRAGYKVFRATGPRSGAANRLSETARKRDGGGPRQRG
jgi:16S rRNA (guanine1207-N2)-methyltransferase